MNISIRMILICLVVFNASSSKAVEISMTNVTERAVNQNIFAQKTRDVNQLLQESYNFAAKSGSHEAVNIALFLKDVVIPAHPSRDEDGDPTIVLIRKPKDGQVRLPLVIIYREDQDISPFWKKIYDQPQVAIFRDNPISILFKNYDMYSPGFRSLVLLHEGMHVNRYLTGIMYKQSNYPCEEEYYTWELESQILNGINSEAIKTAIKAIVLEISNKALKNWKPVNGINVIPPDINSKAYKLLDPILGKSKSKKERQDRIMTLWTHGYLQIINDNFSENSVQMKKKYFCSAFK